MAGHLDFYFFYGSIHSYLSVMRIGALASAAGVEVRWQPFNLTKQATDAARKLGIFGAPTFAVGTEIFWGDDRLEETLGFAAGR